MLFRSGTVHVAVVDPGVGTARRRVVVRTARHTFVAPDNGVLSRVLEQEALEGANLLESEDHRRAEVSPTFEGREVTLGPRAGAWYLVREGLAEGEEVVVRGAFKLDSELQIREGRVAERTELARRQAAGQAG